MERAEGKVGDGIERAERFDAVDREGRRRASFGVLGRFPDQGDVVGFELLDVEGKAAVTVVLDDTGAATLSFSTAGNEVLVVGVSAVDGGPAAFATACRLDGSAAASVYVRQQGDVAFDRGEGPSGLL